MNALTTAHLLCCQLQTILAAMPIEQRHAPSASKRHAKAYRRHHANAPLTTASRPAPAPPELGSVSTCTSRRGHVSPSSACASRVE